LYIAQHSVTTRTWSFKPELPVDNYNFISEFRLDFPDIDNHSAYRKPAKSITQETVVMLFVLSNQIVFRGQNAIVIALDLPARLLLSFLQFAKI